MSTITTINENDVLLGRGGRNHEHSGNEQLRNICRSRVDDYQRATKKQKAVISREVLNQIHAMEPPGRFLLKNYSTYAWDIVSPAVAREKCCQALRDAVAVEKDKVPPEPLPDILDVLSSDQFHAESITVSSSNHTRKRKRSSHPIVTPAKRSTEEYEHEEETYRYNRSGRDDDFDLFDGELLTSKDKVLATVTTSITEV